MYSQDIFLFWLSFIFATDLPVYAHKHVLVYDIGAKVSELEHKLQSLVFKRPFAIFKSCTVQHSCIGPFMV